MINITENTYCFIVGGAFFEKEELIINDKISSLIYANMDYISVRFIK